MRTYDEAAVLGTLSYALCIPAVRAAMLGLSNGASKQIPRAMLGLSEGRLLGLMGGAISAHGAFGAKIVSVAHANFALGRPSLQGLVLLFDPATGAPLCVADAAAITAVHTAAASAVATDALARPDARTLAILGYGVQAASHIRALLCVRPFDEILIWGRSRERAQTFCAKMSAETGVRVRAVASAREAAAGAEVIATVSAAQEPILEGAWVQSGTHVNVVGSSVAGPAEVDSALVCKSLYIADCIENVLRSGAEFLRAKEAGFVGDDHIVGEIGQVLAGARAGRRSESEITLYKSLGHIVQDIAAVAALHDASEQR